MSMCFLIGRRLVIRLFRLGDILMKTGFGERGLGRVGADVDWGWIGMELVWVGIELELGVDTRGTDSF